MFPNPKLKTQTYGRANNYPKTYGCSGEYFYAAVQKDNLRAPRAYDGVYLEPRLEAVKNYREMRENGGSVDNPSHGFPQDGGFSWEVIFREQAMLRYTEGGGDKAWMEEKDRNYLSRLARENAIAEEHKAVETQRKEMQRLLAEHTQMIEQLQTSLPL